MEGLLYNLNIAAGCALIWVCLMLVTLAISAHIEGHTFKEFVKPERKDKKPDPPPNLSGVQIGKPVTTSLFEVEEQCRFAYPLTPGYEFRYYDRDEQQLYTIPHERVMLYMKLDHADEWAKKAYAEGVPLEDIFA